MDHVDFGDVLAAARSGAPWACTEIWSRYAPGVAAFLRARGSAEADDLTSEVFIAVFTTLEGFSGDEAAFRGYVYTLAYRRWVDEVRRRSRRPAETECPRDTTAGRPTAPSRTRRNEKARRGRVG